MEFKATEFDKSSLYNERSIQENVDLDYEKQRVAKRKMLASDTEIPAK